MDDRLSRIRRKLETMPSPERSVFDRARYRGLDYVEIAAELGTTVAEVERLIARAMLYLVGE